MPPKTSKRSSDATRRDLISEYKITFQDDLLIERWPSNLRLIFSKIKELGRYAYQSWRQDIYVDPTRPWREETKTRADAMVALAQQCKADKSNEIAWRIKLESVIFHRFELEVDWSVSVYDITTRFNH